MMNLPAPSAAPPVSKNDTAFQIQFEEGKILFSAVRTPLNNILKGLYADFRIRITGFENRGTEPVTYTIRADSLQDVIRGLMRHLAVKNYALEHSDGKLTRVSVFPEARHTVSSEPARPPSETTQKEDAEPKQAASAVAVQSIIDDSQAQGADLREGDIIVEYGGSKITRAAELVKESRKRTTDEEVEMLVIREGERIRVSVKGGFIGVRIKTVKLPAEPGKVN
jgi:C-terminal processing protease CtpA/Prc